MIKDKIWYIFLPLTILSIVLAGLVNGLTYDFFKISVAILFMCLFSVQDIRERRLSNKLMLIMLGISIIMIAATVNVGDYLVSFISGIGIFLVMFVMYLVSMRTLGFGDVKLFSVIAFLIGFGDAVQIIFMTLVLTVVVGIFIGIYKKQGLKMELPMIPFAFFATIVNNILILIFR